MDAHSEIKWGQVPLLLPIVCFIAGLLCGFAGWAPTWAMAMIIPALIALFYRRLALSACIIAASVGWCDASLQFPTPLPQRLVNGSHTVSGVVSRVSESMERGAVSVDVEVDSIDGAVSRPRRVSLTVVSPHSVFFPSQRVTWHGQLEPVRKPQLPQMTDLAAPMRRRGVSATSLVRHAAIISVTDEPGWLNDLLRVRVNLQRKLLSADLTSESAAMLNAVLLGDTSWLAADQRSEYGAAGLSHILALSGMHVALLAMIVGWLLWPLSLVGGRRLVELTAIALLWIYACVTGLSPSVVRAVTMGTVFVIARLLQRRSSPYNSLCLAALVILVPSPGSLFTYGFQLSFVAVLAIVTFAAPLNPVSRRRHPWLYAAVAYVTVSVSAMLGAGVLSAYYFHSFPVYFILSATIAALLLPWICGCGILVLLLTACGLSSAPLCSVTDSLIHLLDLTAHAVSSLPGASVTGIYMSAAELWLCLLTVAVLGLWLHQRSHASGVAVMLCAAALLLMPLVKPAPPQPKLTDVIPLPYKGEPATLVRVGDKATLVTTAANRDTTLLRVRTLRDFDEYLHRHHVTSIKVTAR